MYNSVHKNSLLFTQTKEYSTSIFRFSHMCSLQYNLIFKTIIKDNKIVGTYMQLKIVYHQHRSILNIDLTWAKRDQISSRAIFLWTNIM